MQPSDPGAVDRIEAGDWARFDPYYRRGQPVIVTGGMASWAALDSWAPESLARRFGAMEVPLQRSDGDVFARDAHATPTWSEQRVPLATAVERIAGDDPTARYYIRQLCMLLEFTELLDDIDVPRWLIDRVVGQVNFWLGGRGCVSPAHYDRANNLTAQVYGRKRWTLFDPGQTELLHPYPATTEGSHFSQVDTEAPDLARFADFGQTRPLELTLEPGEMLLVPAYWWHAVRSLEVAIAVNFWWEPEPWQDTVFRAIGGLAGSWA